MKLPAFEKNHSLPALFGLTFVVFGWFALSLTLGSLFLFPLVATGFAFLSPLVLVLCWKLFQFSPLDFRIVFVVALLYALGVGFTIEPTLFSGRDQGSIAEAAYRLATNTELAFTLPGSDSFFQIYGPGTALNFPGFAYTKEGYLMTQFPLGYTAWLAGFISLFGQSGFAISNALLLFLFLLFLYQLVRLFVHPFYASAALILAMTSFLPSWFAKLTLSENLAAFLFLFLCYTLILFFREGKFLYYVAILLTGSLLAFTRIEGFAFLFLALALIAFHPHTRLLFRTYPWKSIALPGVLFTFFLLRDFFLNLPYYKMIGKAFLKFLHSFSQEAMHTSALAGNPFGLGSVFFLYGTLALFCLGLFGILFLLRKKQWLILVPVCIALPTFVYLFQPSITPDYPWMLRRYFFTLFPTLLFSAVIGVAFLFSERGPSSLLERPRNRTLLPLSLIFAGLVLLQFPAWSSQITFAEQRGLQNQVATFTQNFSEKDLILVDRNVTGDGFAMLSGPAQFLFHKNTVYFFNPYDLSALNTSPFERVFLLTPEESQGRYTTVFGDRLVFKKSVTFSLEQFEHLTLSPNDPLRLPKKTTKETVNLLYQIY